MTFHFVRSILPPEKSSKNTVSPWSGKASRSAAGTLIAEAHSTAAREARTVFMPLSLAEACGRGARTQLTFQFSGYPLCLDFFSL
jgi:hypothetical protein